MKLYYSTSQFPELAGLRLSEKRPILRAASKLLRRDDPWFVPAVVWLNSLCSGTLCGLAIMIYLIAKPSFGTLTSVILAFAAIIPVAAISGFAVEHLGLSRIHPYVRRAISERESQPPKEHP